MRTVARTSRILSTGRSGNKQAWECACPLSHSRSSILSALAAVLVCHVCRVVFPFCAASRLLTYTRNSHLSSSCLWRLSNYPFLDDPSSLSGCVWYMRGGVRHFQPSCLQAIRLPCHLLLTGLSAVWSSLVFCSFLVFCCGEDGDMFGANFMASVERLLEDAGYDWGDESDPEVRKTPLFEPFST